MMCDTRTFLRYDQESVKFGAYVKCEIDLPSKESALVLSPRPLSGTCLIADTPAEKAKTSVRGGTRHVPDRGPDCYIK